jgi:hypothetical protein
MEQSKIDSGTISALMIRFRESRLPRARRMLEKVNQGHKLSDEDIAYLKRIYEDSRKTQSLIQRHPEYMTLVSAFLELYTEIITRGLENERSA